MKNKNKWIEKKELSEKYFAEKFYLRFFYAPAEKLVGDRGSTNYAWEHHEIYNFSLKNPEKYYRNFDPVIVKYDKKIKKYVFVDGFHRVNFCKHFNLPVPCVILTPKKGLHVHEYRTITGTYRHYVTDEECKHDFETKNPAILDIKCLKDKDEGGSLIPL